MDITELLAFSVQHKSSDLHLSAGVPPLIRVDGDVRRDLGGDLPEGGAEQAAVEVREW